MASLATGSVNFPTIVYANQTPLVEDLASKMRDNGVRPEIEVFDLSHLHGARRLADRGLLDERPHVQFVMGIQNAMPAHEHLLDVLLTEAKRLFPSCTWTAAGIGRHQAEVMSWALARGADAVRTGLEDNIRISRIVSRRATPSLCSWQRTPSLSMGAALRHRRKRVTSLALV